MLLVALANLVFVLALIEGVGIRNGGFVGPSGFMETGGLERLRFRVNGRLLKVLLLGRIGIGSSDGDM